MEGIWIPIDSSSDHCKPNYFCKNNSTISWVRDNDSHSSLNNWMDDFDMDCTPSTLISAFGMAFFTTYAFGNVFLPPLADKYGRKNVFLISLSVQMV